ncbi:MAG: hypothetical protein QOI29_5468, partial [Mycobacterium sp.]|nr:hypothetical protein [Mycobacterium sp.]MDT5187310.1 hypothetical protein [Mycobacterium sp.]
MEYPTGFREQGWHRLPDSVREQFW